MEEQGWSQTSSPFTLVKNRGKKICIEGKGTLRLFSLSISTKKKKKIMISNFSLSLYFLELGIAFYFCRPISI